MPFGTIPVATYLLVITVIGIVRISAPSLLNLPGILSKSVISSIQFYDLFICKLFTKLPNTETVVLRIFREIDFL